MVNSSVTVPFTGIDVEIGICYFHNHKLADGMGKDSKVRKRYWSHRLESSDLILSI